MKHRCQPLFSYAFKDALDEHSTRHEIEVFLKNLSESDDPFVSFGMSLKPTNEFEKRSAFSVNPEINGIRHCISVSL